MVLLLFFLGFVLYVQAGDDLLALGRVMANFCPPFAEAPTCMSLGSSSLSGAPSLHCPSAAVCIGILPGLGAYSGSSDSESSSDSEGTINATGKIVSSIFRTNTFLEAP